MNIKFFFLLVTVILIALAGCKESDIQESSLKENPPAGSSKELITIPPDSSGSESNIYSVTKSVDGSSGDNKVLYYIYHTQPGRVINIHAELKIPKDAFPDTVNITMTTDDHFALIYFAPHMNFNQPLNLNLSFTGLDLNSLIINPKDFDFGFVDDNGNFEHVDCSTLNINANAGLISVTGAKLNHFSRYGFIR